MIYRVHWRLLGRENRILDGGEIDGGYADRSTALQAISAFLQQFAAWGRSDADGSWWARRSADADLWVQIVLCEEELAASEVDAAVWTGRQGASASLRPE